MRSSPSRQAFCGGIVVEDLSRLAPSLIHGQALILRLAIHRGLVSFVAWLHQASAQHVGQPPWLGGGK